MTLNHGMTHVEVFPTVDEFFRIPGRGPHRIDKRESRISLFKKDDIVFGTKSAKNIIIIDVFAKGKREISITKRSSPLALPVEIMPTSTGFGGTYQMTKSGDKRKKLFGFSGLGECFNCLEDRIRMALD